MFAYDVEFSNGGSSAVQLLSRHWVFVDENGKSEEIKGPGAKGATPIISMGGKWKYHSGTRLQTPRGSMHGWFTFENLDTQQLFTVPIGRLALSREGRAEMVPCVPDGDGRKLPATSVHSTERVIVGAVVELARHDKEVGMYAFEVDVQVNNARSVPVLIVGHRWEIIDANGQRLRSESHGIGVQDGRQLTAIKMPAGSAMRIRCEMPQLYTSSAVISGMILARPVDPFDPEEYKLENPDDEPVELLVAPLGASADGRPVPEYKPLGFLAD